MGRLFYFVFSFFYISVAITYAQSQNAVQSQYKFKHITVDQGLSNNNVRAICQDSKGFIWLATRNGVDKFDGQIIVPYRHDPHDTSTISSNMVKTVFLDSKNNIWVGSDGGLDFYNSSFNNFIRFKHKDINWPLGNIEAVVEDENGNLWFGGETGLYVYNLNSRKIQHFSNETGNIHGIPSNIIYKLLVDKNNNLWISVMKEGLCLYNQKEEAFKCFKNDPDDPRSISGNQIERLYEDSKGYIWAGTMNNGLNLYVAETSSFISTIPDPNNSYTTRVRAIFEDFKGNFFVGTRGGIYIRNDRTNEFEPYAYEGHNFSNLSQNSILNSFIDNTGTLWIGTFSGGVNYSNLNKKDFVHYKTGRNDNHFISGANIYAIAEDTKGNLWLGADNGLNYLDRSDHTFKYFFNDPDNPNSISYNDIKALDWDKNGNLWIGTNKGGLNYYNVETGIFKSYKHDPEDPNSLIGDKIYGLMCDIDNNLWILTSTNIDNQYSSIDMLPNGSDKFIHLSEKAYFGFDQDENGDVYIGGIGGFWIFHKQDSVFSFISNELLIHKVNTIKKDSENNIWLGGDKGLVRYNLNDKSFVSFSEENGYPIAEVFGILEDESYNLWLSTNFGLVKVINIVKSIENIKFRVFDSEDGIQSKQFLYNAFHKSTSGEMFFGGINGFNTFFPNDIRENIVPPKVVLTDLKIFNKTAPIGEKVGGRLVLEKSISETDEIKLGKKQNVFTLEFAALHYANPEKNTFKYKLEGFDTEWQNRKVGGNFVTYSNLSAGEYTFLVSAANNDGVWNDEPVQLKIIIIPPFYKRKLFILFVVIILVLGIYYAVKLRERQLKSDKEILEASLEDGKTQLAKQQNEIEKQQNEIRIKEEEEKEIRWYNTGLAKFSDVLSKNKNNSTALSQAIISNLVDYVDANQGAIFLLNDNDTDNPQLDFSAGYAYTNENEASRTVYPGEGYVGTCFVDKKTIELTDLPESYIKIESGLGKIAPSHIVLIPMIFDDTVSGVIEIASFKKIDKYKIDFIEKVAESATSIITIIRSEKQAQSAVEEAQQNSEELQSADEELRQNLEEMSSIQEELSRKQNALLKEQAMFQTLMDFLDDRITFKDPESVYLRINKVKSDALKLKESKDAIGKSDKHFFGEEHFNKAYKNEKDIFKKGIPIINQEEILRFNDGAIKWGSTTRVPFNTDTGEGAGTLIITKDITDVKSLESKNKAHTNILDDLAQQYPIILYNLDINFKLSDITGNGFEKMGLKLSDLRGKTLFDAFDIPEANFDKNRIDKTVKSEFKTDSTLFSIEHKLVYDEFSEGYICCSIIS